MIRAFKVINESGDELMVELARPEKSGFAVRSITGLGPVKASINTTELAMADGAVFNSARTSARNIVFNLIYYPLFGEKVKSTRTELEEYLANVMQLAGSDTVGRRSVESSNMNTIEPNDPYKIVVMNAEDLRQKTYKYFPVKKEVILVFYTDNRTVYIKGRVESNEPDIFSPDEEASISIICPYPYFRALDNDAVVSFSSITPLFQFSFSNPVNEKTLIMSRISNVIERPINYEGDIDAGTVININVQDTISGDLVIYNNSFSQIFKLKISKIESIIGSSVTSGCRIVASSLPREKYIKLYKDGSEFNILSAMDKFSDWITLSRGVNSFTYSVEPGNQYISLDISYPILYEGI